MAGGLRFLWRPPQGAPRPGPGQYVALSWAHTSFIRCPFRRGMLWAGLPDPDPVAFLSEELARGSSTLLPLASCRALSPHLTPLGAGLGSSVSE